MNMLRNWSKDRIQVSPFEVTLAVKDDWWLKASSMRSDGTILQQVCADVPENYEIYILGNDLALLETYAGYVSDPLSISLNFDEIVILVKKCFTIILNTTKWETSICTCENYLKKYMCLHIMFVALNNTLTRILLPKKVKPGPKKPKAKNALEKQ
jgi:hypothetical protein